jgi:hypothetical protein
MSEALEQDLIEAEASEETGVDEAPVDDTPGDVADTDSKSDFAGELEVIRQELEQQKQKNQYLEMVLNQGFQQRNEPQGEPDYDMDDVLTRRDVERLLEQRLGNVQESTKQMRFSMQVENARSRYSDYMDAIGVLQKKAQEPGFEWLNSAFENADNPPEAAYMYAKSLSEFQTKAKKASAGEIASRAQENLNRQRTLSSVGGTGKSDANNRAAKFSNMSQEEFSNWYENWKRGIE